MKKKVLPLFLLLTFGLCACMDEEVVPEQIMPVDDLENIKGEADPPTYPTYPVYPPMPVGS